MRRTLPLFSLMLGLGLGLGLVTLPACGGGGGEGCTKDADCKGTRICNYDTNTCEEPGDGGLVDCATDADCDTASGQLCHPDDKRCFKPECVETAECGEGLRCDGFSCVEKECENTVQCDPGLFCETTEGLCVECAQDADCDTGMACQDFTCVAVGPCRQNDPPTCDGTKYQNADAGNYATDAYPKFILHDGTTEKLARVGTATIQGTLVSGEIGAFWALTNRDPEDASFLNIFGSASDVRVSQVWQLVTADFQPVGDPIMRDAPHSSSFSPLQHFIYVEVPPDGSGYEPDMIKDYDTLKQAMADPSWGGRYRMDFGHDADIVAFQPVDPGVALEQPDQQVPPTAMPRLREWWYDGQKVYGYMMPTSLDSPYVNVKSVSGDPLSEPPTPFVPRAFIVYWDDGNRRLACNFGQTNSWNGTPVIFDSGFGDATYSPLVKAETVLVDSTIEYSTACASVPTDYAGVSTKINAGDYTVEPGTIFMVTPQLPVSN